MKFSFRTVSKLSSVLNLKLKNSDQDNFTLDNTYIESAIFALWKIDITGNIKIKASLAKNFHIQPSEVDRMPMWEYELFMKELNDLVKSENDEQKKEMDKYDLDKYSKMSNPNYIKNMTPKIPNYSIPKM